MRQFSCSSVVSECDAQFTGESDDEVLGQVADHAADVHGMTEIPPDVLAKVQAGITTI